ncbi:MAG: DUF2513 domain-containing protein [Planctomycetaceae bacterium]|nr:DUF2513 domain-containing protein [Planctomycetaceae bacterium]
MSLSGDTNLHVAILSKIDTHLKQYPDAGIEGDQIIIEGYPSNEIIEYLFEQEKNGLITGNDTSNQRSGKLFFVRSITMQGYDYLKQYKKI